jgi:Omp85 superfamily domain
MRAVLTMFLVLFLGKVAGQAKPDTLDVNTLISRWTGKQASGSKPPSGISLLPAIGYNPSLGFILGANITAGKYLGDHTTTSLSTATATAYFTTKGVINLQLRHNVFTKNNGWNFQGNGQITKMVVLDYGIGNGSGKSSREGFSVMQYSTTNDTAVFPIKFNHIRLHEKAYKKVSKNIMVGAGVNIDYYFDINDKKLNVDSQQYTPHYLYSKNAGISPTHYFTNGLLLNIQYITREHANRSYGGTLADITIKANPKWMGSTVKSTQLMTEFRKYISLSHKNPETVLAFWHLGNFLLDGKLPYLDMPATASDTYNRSGRAYTIGRFRGPSFFYLESELRYPITANKLLSGVVFANIQTVSDASNKNLFRAFEPAAGAGLRIFFNRTTRTNICIDYAVGKYGSHGLFFGLNEVF